MKDNIYTLSVDEDNSLIKYEFKSNTDVVICVDRVELSEGDISKIEKECQNLIEKVNRYSAEGRDFLNEIKKTGQHLTDLLFSRFIKEELRHCKEKYLKIEISEFMMKIPWELLCIDNQFLGEKFRVGRIIKRKGNKVLKFEHEDKDMLDMLIISDTKGDLKSAYDECIEICNFREENNININIVSESDISKEKLKKIIRDYDIVHVACHGKYSSESGFDNGWYLTEGSFTIQDIQDMAGGKSMPIFVFSNACQSARMTEWRFNTEKQISGLASEFVFYGSKHAVGTFWDIIDSRGSEFALSFYKDLFSGKSVGESMQKNFYPGYILIGDPSIKYFPHFGQTEELEESEETEQSEQQSEQQIEQPKKTTESTRSLREIAINLKNKIKNEPILLFFTIWLLILILYVLGNKIINLGNEVIGIINNRERIKQIQIFEQNVKKELKEISELKEKFKLNKGKFEIKNYTIAVDNELNGQFQELRDIVMTAIQIQILDRTCFELYDHKPFSYNKFLKNSTDKKLIHEPEKILYYVVHKQYLGSIYYSTMKLVDMKNNMIEDVFHEDFIYNPDEKALPQVGSFTDLVNKLNEYPFEAIITDSSGGTVTINKGYHHGVKNGQFFSDKDSILTMTVDGLQRYSSKLKIKPINKEYPLKKGMIIYRKCHKDK